MKQNPRAKLGKTKCQSFYAMSTHITCLSSNKGREWREQLQGRGQHKGSHDTYGLVTKLNTPSGSLCFIQSHPYPHYFPSSIHMFLLQPFLCDISSQHLSILSFFHHYCLHTPIIVCVSFCVFDKLYSITLISRIEPHLMVTSCTSSSRSALCIFFYSVLH